MADDMKYMDLAEIEVVRVCLRCWQCQRLVTQFIPLDADNPRILTACPMCGPEIKDKYRRWNHLLELFSSLRMLRNQTIKTPEDAKAGFMAPVTSVIRDLTKARGE